MRRSRALPQHSVGLFRDVLDLHTWHDAIMALKAPIHNRAVIGYAGAFARWCRSWVLLRSVPRLDGWDHHQVLARIGEVGAEGDQRVGAQLGQGGVLGVEGVRPPEQAGGLPGDALQDAVAQQPDPRLPTRPTGRRPQPGG